MHESAEELAQLQRLLDASAAAMGPHIADIITPDRHLSAATLCERLPGMRLLTVATTAADGRPFAGAVDGYLIHGSWYFSSGRNSVRMRHLRERPAVSAVHLPDESLQVSVHGQVELFEFSDPVHGAMLRQAMLDHYLPIQGPSFEEWMDSSDDAMGARIIATKMFVFHLNPEE